MPNKRKKTLFAILASVALIGLFIVILNYSTQAESKLTNDIQKPDKNIALQDNKAKEAEESIELQPEEPIEPEKEKPAAEEPKNTTESEPIKVELKTPAKSSTQTKPSTSKPAPKPEPTPTPTPTPTPPPPPEPTPSRPTTYTVSNPGIFYEVEGSAVPGNKRYAELSIIMICMNRQTRQYDAELYKKQIQELRATILPVLGESITNQVIKAAESKTHTDVRISERFETATKKVWIASNPGDSLVSFQSWSK
jgi:outer membrane biosynthesis protein TonB